MWGSSDGCHFKSWPIKTSGMTLYFILSHNLPAVCVDILAHLGKPQTGNVRAPRSWVYEWLSRQSTLKPPSQSLDFKWERNDSYFVKPPKYHKFIHSLSCEWMGSPFPLVPGKAPELTSLCTKSHKKKNSMFSYIFSLPSLNSSIIYSKGLQIFMSSCSLFTKLCQLC